MAKAGARPVVDIYSTFLQRSYDQIFQEVALQDLPVVFCLDRAGLVGADGPTHHGSYDLAYLRVFPNMVVMAPGDEKDIAPDVRLRPGARRRPSRSAIPGPTSTSIERDVQPIELGQAEILEWETDGMLLACGAMVGTCLRVAERLRKLYGLRVGVVNARFVKPLDRETIGKAIEECGFVLTVEEGCLMGGFGSAVLEAANDAGLSTAHVRRLGLPDRYVLHAERDEQLAEVGLDVDGITRAALDLARAVGMSIPELVQGQGHQRPGLAHRAGAWHPGRQARGQVVTLVTDPRSVSDAMGPADTTDDRSLDTSDPRSDAGPAAGDPAAGAPAAPGGHPGQRDQARGPRRGRRADASACRGTPGLELAGVDLSADSRPLGPAGRRGRRARRRRHRAAHGAADGGPAHARSWGSTSAGSASWPT